MERNMKRRSFLDMKVTKTQGLILLGIFLVLLFGIDIGSRRVLKKDIQQAIQTITSAPITAGEEGKNNALLQEDLEKIENENTDKNWMIFEGVSALVILALAIRKYIRYRKRKQMEDKRQQNTNIPIRATKEMKK